MKKLKMLLTITLAFFSLSAKSGIINVDANAHMISVGLGASTGYFFNEGDHFTASVDKNDLWSVYGTTSTYWTDADGLDGDLYATADDDSGRPVGTLIGLGRGMAPFAPDGFLSHAGTLLGSIDGNFFKVGTNFSGEAIATGELLLWMADGGPQNNFGSLAVTINNASVPEPSVAILFLLSLLLLVSNRGQLHSVFRINRLG